MQPDRSRYSNFGVNYGIPTAEIFFDALPPHLVSRAGRSNAKISDLQIDRYLSQDIPFSSTSLAWLFPRCFQEQLSGDYHEAAITCVPPLDSSFVLLDPSMQSFGIVPSLPHSTTPVFIVGN